MSITAQTPHHDRVFCTSKVRKHQPPGASALAIVELMIGDSWSALCEECARDAFNALGFLITSKTGESIAQLVGLKKRKAKS